MNNKHFATRFLVNFSITQKIEFTYSLISIGNPTLIMCDEDYHTCRVKNITYILDGVEVTTNVCDDMVFKCAECEFITCCKDTIEEHCMHEHTPNNFEFKVFETGERVIVCKLCCYPTTKKSTALEHNKMHIRYQFPHMKYLGYGVISCPHRNLPKCKQCGMEACVWYNKDAVIFINKHNAHHDEVNKKRLLLFHALMLSEGIDEYVAKEITQRAYPLNKVV